MVFVSGRTPYGPVAAKSIPAKPQVFWTEFTFRVQKLKLQLLLNLGHQREANKGSAVPPPSYCYLLVAPTAAGRVFFRPTSL